MSKSICISVFCVLVGASGLTAQHIYSLEPVSSVNTVHDDILSGRMAESVLITANDVQNLVNDYSWNTHFIYRIKSAQRGASFKELRSPLRLLNFPGERSEGTASYNPQDSSLYFSTSENYGGAKGTKLKLYRTTWNGHKWTEPVLLPLCNNLADYAHPYYSPEEQMLVFSSSRSGSLGGMDIWYTYLNGDQWTEPVNPGPLVNTSKDEMFPVVFEGDIYYCSNGILPERGFELFRCPQEHEWKSAVQLPDPLNSPGDDVMICFLDRDHGFVSSNRGGGVGGDDVYYFERTEFGNASHRYAAVLEAGGIPFSNAGITVANALGEVIMEGTTDDLGSLSLGPVRMNRKVKVQVNGVDPSRFKECVLHITDERGNRIRSFPLNEFGWVELELLPFDYSEIELYPNEDRSWLSVTIEGELIDQENMNSEAGEPITIVDDNGQPVAVAFTGRNGQFSFQGVNPELTYTFRLGAASKAKQVVIMDKGERIVLPVLKEEAVYSRIRQDEAIEIVNDRNESVFVSAADIFVVNRIYYDYRMSRLTGESAEQLDNLASLLARNPSLGVDIHSYTDSRGSAEDNLVLSQERAESVVRFLGSRGIAGERIRAFGMGESGLLNHCVDGVECPEELHAINRRTEIRFRSFSKW